MPRKARTISDQGSVLKEILEAAKKLNSAEVEKLRNRHFQIGLYFETEAEQQIIHDFLFINRYHFAFGDTPSVKQATEKERISALDYAIFPDEINEFNLKSFDACIFILVHKNHVARN